MTGGLRLFRDGDRASHARVNGAVVFERAYGVVGKAITFAIGKVAAIRAGHAISFSHSVCSAILVGPSHRGAFLDRDICRAEGKALDSDAIGRCCRAATI